MEEAGVRQAQRRGSVHGPQGSQREDAGGDGAGGEEELAAVEEGLQVPVLKDEALACSRRHVFGGGVYLLIVLSVLAGCYAWN